MEYADGPADCGPHVLPACLWVETVLDFLCRSKLRGPRGVRSEGFASGRGDGLSLCDGIFFRLKTFSPRHRHYLAAVLRQIVIHYGDSLVGLAVFGSYARGDNRLNSDLDLLIVLDHAPAPGRRLREFVEEVEMKHEALAQELYEREDILCELSPYILTREEALKLHPIYYDLAAHHLILYDPEGVIARIIAGTRKFLERSGARRIPHGNTWGWSLEKPCFPGGIDL